MAQRAHHHGYPPGLLDEVTRAVIEYPRNSRAFYVGVIEGPSGASERQIRAAIKAALRSGRIKESHPSVLVPRDYSVMRE